MWCDGNTHAGEVTGCQACLHFIDDIVTKWEAGDSWTKDVMASSTLYVLPRVSPDGAECARHCLQARPFLLARPDCLPDTSLHGRGILVVVP